MGQREAQQTAASVIDCRSVELHQVGTRGALGQRIWG